MSEQKKNRVSTSIAIFLCVALIGCTQTSQKETIRIHDSSGFSERPSDYASYDPATAIVDKDEKNMAALESLAEQDPLAAYDLGLRFFRGEGVRQDSYKAIQWMRQAAEHGNLDAQKALGHLYLTGLEEMGPDPQEAERWLTIAAGRGDKESENLLREAVEARKHEQTYYRWRTERRSKSSHYWSHGYPYRYNWRHGRWWHD